MKTKKYIFALFFLCSIFNAQSSNNYVWLHGLNDASDCWKIYQNAFTPTNGHKLYYNSGTSIQNISSNMWSNNSSKFLGNENILIGHSMGGLIARELEYNHSSSFKGIITIGTPHQGAPVLAELYNGGANNLTIKIANKAINSIEATATAICFTIPGVGFVLPTSINLGLESLYQYVGIPYIDELINEEIAADLSAQCVKDMVPGSAYMSNIATRKVKVPILTFACQEDRWQIARLGYCAQNANTLQDDANLNADGNYDMGGYNQLNSLNGTIKTVGGVHAGIAVGCAVGGFFCPYLWAASVAHGVASVSWYSTAGYIDDGLDYDHGILVGNYGYEQRTFCYEKLICPEVTLPYEPTNGSQKISITPSVPIEDCYTELVCENRIVAVPVGHDGVVSTYTQQLDKTKGTNVIWANATIKGVNHMEEFNHKNTRAEFNKAIVLGGYGPTFYRGY